MEFNILKIYLAIPIFCNENDLHKIHPHLKTSPMSFEYQKYKFIDGELKPDKYSITKGRQPNTGYSDHFPIKCISEIH